MCMRQSGERGALPILLQVQSGHQTSSSEPVQWCPSPTPRATRGSPKMQVRVLSAPAQEEPIKEFPAHKRQRSSCKECRGSFICQHQRRRSTCKECRKESDEVMSDGLEELVEGTYRTAAGPKLWAPPRRKAASHLQGHRLGA